MFALKKNRFFFSNMILDEEGETETTAKMYFKSGDKYEGYVFMNNPQGQGKLRMKDKSYYQGEFSEWGLKRGKFCHSSKMFFEGDFNYDNFKKGTFTFSNGDFFEGVWSLRGSLWILNSGSFYHRSGKVMEKFTGDIIKKKDLQTKRIRIVYPSQSHFFKGAGFYEGEYNENDEPVGSGIFIAAQPYWKQTNLEDGFKHGVQRYYSVVKRVNL